MNAMTCQEVEAQLDLLAAGECDPPLREAMQAHLQQCPACAARHAESQAMIEQLNLHLKPGGLERLQKRIDEEAQPRTQPKLRLFTPLVRRVALAAAVILVAVGLVWWLPRDSGDQKGTEPQFALLVQARKTRVKIDPVPALIKDKSAEALVMVPLAARDGEALRRELAQAARGDKLPPPPEVPLELVLVNAGQETVEVRLGDAAAQLTLDMPGDGAIRIAAPKADTPDVLRPRTLHLDAGKQHVFLIDRLVAGAPGKLENIYLTEPGEYKMTAHLRFTVDGRVVTVSGPTVRIKVEQ